MGAVALGAVVRDVPFHLRRSCSHCGPLSDHHGGCLGLTALGDIRPACGVIARGIAFLHRLPRPRLVYHRLADCPPWQPFGVLVLQGIPLHEARGRQAVFRAREPSVFRNGRADGARRCHRHGRVGVVRVLPSDHSLGMGEFYCWPSDLWLPASVRRAEETGHRRPLLDRGAQAGLSRLVVVRVPHDRNIDQAGGNRSPIDRCGMFPFHSPPRLGALQQSRVG
mmetsp:Transcript_67030/g.187159  ORF Transcript_67030/g.187159 Transcript_67030/m.187159 type:complete len:223 (+) Transcript_67030:829-1497(+)